MAVAGIVAVVLGWFGYDESARILGLPSDPFNNLYSALQLFELREAEVPAQVPWQLNIARFLAPTITLLAAGDVAFALLNQRLTGFWARRSHDHVVVCGLGRLGARAAKLLKASGRQVVVIESNPANAEIGICRERHILVLEGDATDPAILELAGVRKARYLLALADDEHVNAKIAIDARRLSSGRKNGSLTCFINVHEGPLVDLLNELGIKGADESTFRLEALNAAELGARTMLDRNPPFDSAGTTPLGPPHLLVVGLDEMGSRLIVEAARRWRQLGLTRNRRLLITAVDRDADARVKALEKKYPALQRLCRLQAKNLSPTDPEFAGGEFLTTTSGHPDVTGAYVGTGDDVAGLHAALSLRHRFRDQHVPIVVRTTQEGGAAAFLGEDPGHPLHEDIVMFGLYDLICEPEVLLNGRTEILARQLHADYLLNRGPSAEPDASAVPWERLPENLRESNRQNALDVFRKLRAVGCDIEPLADWDAHLLEFAPQMVEQMAEMEHERWVAERRADGWRLSERRGVGREETPYLVPYAELPPDIQEYDRVTVRDYPRLLASIGYSVVRVIQPAPTPSSQVVPAKA